MTWSASGMAPSFNWTPTCAGSARRWRRSVSQPRESEPELRGILHELVRRSGLREAYVAMDCLRGSPPAGVPRHPANARPYLAAFAIPYVWLMPREIIDRGAHLIIASTPRIPPQCVDPRAKNFHWADMTRALFEAHDAGADNPVLLGLDGNVTEGPGFNVFAVSDGVAATPDSGVLEGITRLSVIELCDKLGIRCEQRPVPAAELREADEVLITSTAGGVIGVTRLDNRIIGNDRPGPLTMRLHDAVLAAAPRGMARRTDRLRGRRRMRSARSRSDRISVIRA